MISKQALEEFKEIWRKENPGQDIDDETAMNEATALLTLMDKVYRPIRKEWVDTKNLEKEKEALEHHDHKQKDNELSDEAFKALVELGEALRKIHNRMIAEGYEIKEGKVVKRNSVEQGGVTTV